MWQAAVQRKPSLLAAVLLGQPVKEAMRPLEAKGIFHVSFAISIGSVVNAGSPVSEKRYSRLMPK
jgi:hypothetical protein